MEALGNARQAIARHADASDSDTDGDRIADLGLTGGLELALDTQVVQRQQTCRLTYQRRHLDA